MNSRPNSPPSTNSSPRHLRRPSMSSISKPMSWLRTSHNNHGSSANNHTINISEPKLIHDMFTASSGPTAYTHARYGALGSGATVVRTPQDALAHPMRIQTQPYPPQEHPGSIRPEDDDASSYEEDEPPSPNSPPLPPVPYASKSSPEFPVLTEMGELIGDPCRTLRAKPSPSRPIPETPEKVARSTVKSVPISPVMPLNVISTPPQPPFSPILLSPAPDVLLDLSTLMVTLETSTASLRTTYATLTSRPSHLAEYLHSIARQVHEREKRKFRDTLVEEEEVDDGERLEEPDTPFASLFAAHLNSVGLLPHSAGMIHMFLDRPSAPYAHILTYLRSPTSSPAALPRAARADMEMLFELRDEAKYLGLDELHKLCCDEIRAIFAHNATAHSPQVHTPGHNRANSGNGQVLYVPTERGRGGSVRIREIIPGRMNNKDDRHSGTSAGSHNTGSRSTSRGPPKSAEEWI